MISLFNATYTKTHAGGASVNELPACSAADTLQRERGQVCGAGGRVQSVGTGAGGVRGQDGGPEAGPRADDSATAATGSGARGDAGQTLSAEEQQPEPGGPAQGAGDQVQTCTDCMKSGYFSVFCAVLLNSDNVQEQRRNTLTTCILQRYTLSLSALHFKKYFFVGTNVVLCYLKVQRALGW